uniref:cytochrome c oxidase subunit II n=1 Tax=Musculium lacustre TaxID=98299 RepID=UPI00223773A6|nr:cytochrome c oxidase subunit II [Musculium lacustre]UYR45705.1 cytochrome c oxidase subunit II [Musculium lacustre]
MKIKRMWMMSYWNQFGLSDPITLRAQKLVLYHDMILIVMIFVLFVVGFFLVSFVLKKGVLSGLTFRSFSGNELLECIWTLAPVMILFVLALVSGHNLYHSEVGVDVEMGVKVTGRQWYWQYEYLFSNTKKMLEMCGLSKLEVFKFFNVNFDTLKTSDSWLLNYVGFFVKGEWSLAYDSYMVNENDLGIETNKFNRNIDVSDPLYLPKGLKSELLIQTGDVIHSWGVSSMGVKMDAIPGRSNSLAIEPLSVGVVTGFCYELCGQNHSAMPIVVEISSMSRVLKILILKLFSEIEEEKVLNTFSWWLNK